MKKLYVIIALTIAGVTFVNAEEGGIRNQIQNRIPMMRQLIGQNGGGDISQMMTGDANIDIQIKALNTEMEAKIKAIRDDYMEKIKVIIASLTINGTIDEKNKAKKGMMGTTTFPVGKFLGDEDDFLPNPRMRGRNSQPGQEIGSRMMNFFRGFFGNQ